MPYSDYRPDLMGSASLTPSGSFEAGSMQSFTLVYTAGTFGVDDTGSIKIGLRFATDFGPVQFTDPKGAGYTTVEASNGAVLDAKWEFKRNIRPWSRSLYIGVVKDFLSPGDTITIRFGDRRQGSPGIRLQTYCESAFEFRVLADPIATYDYVALPESPKIAIVPGPGVRWRAVLPSLVRTGETFRLAVKADDKWGNPSNLLDRTLKLASDRPVAGLPGSLRFADGTFAALVEGLSVAEPGDDERVEAIRVERVPHRDAPADLREVICLDLGQRLAPVLRRDRHEPVIRAGDPTQVCVCGEQRQRDRRLGVSHPTDDARVAHAGYVEDLAVEAFERLGAEPRDGLGETPGRRWRPSPPAPGSADRGTAGRRGERAASTATCQSSSTRRRARG